MNDEFSRSEMGMVATGLIGLGLACWRAFFHTKRGLREDRAEEFEASAKESLIVTLQGTIRAQDERITVLTQRVDAIAAERTEAKIAAVRMEGEVVHLTGTIAALNKELLRMQNLLDLANETIRTLQSRLSSAGVT